MGMRELEAKILSEAKIVTGIKKLRQKDIMEWTNGTIQPRADEVIYRLPFIGVNIAVAITAVPRPKSQESET